MGLNTKTALSALISLVVALLPAGGSRSARAMDKDPNVIIGVRFDRYSGIIRLPVRFGNRTYPFMLATAQEQSNADADVCAAIGQRLTAPAAPNQRHFQTVPTYRLPPGAIGELTIPALEKVYVFDHLEDRKHGLEVVGDLGMDVLRKFVIRLDFDRGRLSFLHAVPPNAGMAVNLLEGRASPRVMMRIGGLSRAFLLHTGCWIYGAGAIVKNEFEAMCRGGDLVITGEEAIRSWYGVSLQRAAVLRTGAQLGDSAHERLVFNELGRSVDQLNALGLGFMRRYVVTFDFPNRKVYLLPGEQFYQLDAGRDPGGLRFRQDGDRLVVSRVASNYRASAAGIEQGDVVAAINGRKIADLDKTDIVRMLSAGDQQLSIVFSRGRERRAIHYTLPASAGVRAGASR